MEKYPALNINVNSARRHEQLDMDYLDKLNEEELEWYNKFMNEYMSGMFPKDDKGNYKKDNFHKTRKERKTCTDRNNARKRDLFIDLKLTNTINYEKDLDEIEGANPIECYLDNKHLIQEELDKSPIDVKKFIKKYFKLFKKKFVVYFRNNCDKA